MGARYQFQYYTLSIQSTHHKEKQTYRLNVYNRKFAHWRYQFCYVDSAECKMCNLVLSLCVSFSYHDNRVIVSKSICAYINLVEYINTHMCTYTSNECVH